MSVTIGNRTLSNPLQYVRKSIAESTGSLFQTQGMVDQIEVMAEGYLALDQSSTDENRKKNQVTFLEDGKYIHAEQDKFGNVKAFERIDETGETPTTIKKSMVEGRPSYQFEVGGQQMIINEDANGTLVFELAQ